MTKSKTAVLIDAENVSVRHIDIIFKELQEKEYDIKIKRAFADWSAPAVSSDDWKNTLNTYAIRPTHLFNFSNGKNASDIQLVIFGMKILYEDPEIQNFILVTSDSDFTPLVLALKENGKTVIGYGGEHASVSLKNACDEFTPIKLNKKKPTPVKKTTPKTDDQKKADPENPKQDLNDICSHIWLEYFWLREKNGWIRMDVFGQKLKEHLKNKTWKACGYKSLKDLVKHQETLETKVVNDQAYMRPVTFGGDWILPAIEDAFKAKSKVMTDDFLEINEIMDFISTKTNNKNITKELICDTPLYETLRDNGNIYLRRKMTSLEKELNTVFVKYCEHSPKNWIHIGAKSKEDIGEKVDEIKNKNSDLSKLSFSQLAKSCCCILFKSESLDNGNRKEYYIKGV